ncbi:MAG: B12-binding domain-containing protein, partial [Chloroflexota bacterium]
MKPQVQRQTDILAQEIVHTVMRGDEDSALRILERLIASGLDGRTIFLDVFQPALYK